MQHPAIIVCDSCIHGKGLVTTALIRAGEVVWRLSEGMEMIPLAEVEAWSEAKRQEMHFVAYQYNEDYFIMADEVDRYMNHSCDPNTWFDGPDTLIARRDIHPGEEVTYDYAMTEIAGNLDIPCSCGSPLCRGRVTCRDHLDPSWQARYEGHLPPHTTRAIIAARAKAQAAHTPGPCTP